LMKILSRFCSNPPHRPPARAFRSKFVNTSHRDCSHFGAGFDVFENPRNVEVSSFALSGLERWLLRYDSAGSSAHSRRLLNVEPRPRLQSLKLQNPGTNETIATMLDQTPCLTRSTGTK
jgi:hypothetical protein